ncbi:BRO1-like domain-containing protein [Blakeslea trispora]|nr:BRO1-like domain-containing protein [Blakeslea trispora]
MLGCSQGQVSTEDMRKSCQFFQSAAGCLKYLSEEIVPELRENPAPDFTIVTTIEALVMAQAHECVWIKAVMEHMKHGTIARLSLKVSDLYHSFLKNALDLPKEWVLYAEIKFNYFKAEAQYHKANEAISSGKYGEEIARLRIAQSANNLASQLIRDNPSLVHQTLIDRVVSLEHSIKRDIARAERDNDFVYMELVPEPNQLAPILRSDMVKPIVPVFLSDPQYWLTLDERPNDKIFIKRPLFEKLLPFAVHQAIQTCNQRTESLIRMDICGKLQILNKDRQLLLQKLNLPYAIDVIDTIPLTLKDYSEEVQHEGGIQSLQDMLQLIQSLSQKTSRLVDEGFNVLEEENEQDVEMSRHFGKRKVMFDSVE